MSDQTQKLAAYWLSVCEEHVDQAPRIRGCADRAQEMADAFDAVAEASEELIPDLEAVVSAYNPWEARAAFDGLEDGLLRLRELCERYGVATESFHEASRKLGGVDGPPPDQTARES